MVRPGVTMTPKLRQRLPAVAGQAGLITMTASQELNRQLGDCAMVFLLDFSPTISLTLLVVLADYSMSISQRTFLVGGTSSLYNYL